MSAEMPTDRAQLPTLEGYPAVANYASRLGVSITPRFVKTAVLNGDLVPYVIAKRNRFAPADVLAWINSMKANTPRTKQQNATASR